MGIESSRTSAKVNSDGEVKPLPLIISAISGSISVGGGGGGAARTSARQNLAGDIWQRRTVPPQPAQLAVSSPTAMPAQQKPFTLLFARALRFFFFFFFTLYPI